MKFGILVLLVQALFAFPSLGADPIWGEGIEILGARDNPLELPSAEFTAARRSGRAYALHYPVEVSGVLMPWEPVREFLDRPSPNPIRLLLQTAFEGFSRIRSTDDLFAKAGLHPYPETEGEGAYEIPFENGARPAVRMGATIFQRENVDVFTISCAACHTSNLFGRKVMGLTNRFPHANEFFVFGKKGSSLVGEGLFRSVMGASRAEGDTYARLRERAHAVGAKVPATAGLDTSLAQVALSLARRNTDDYATFDRSLEKHPRPEVLGNFVADSKPAVWWNLKYKNRWLSDGSVISGNPIYTNILWNEIGRGTDLKELQLWLDRNSGAIRDLTTAVFSAEAPRFTDFFPAEKIDMDRALRGEKLFNQACAKCHGTYVKAWSLPRFKGRPWADRLQTVEVDYPHRTKVIDVGTDPNRWQGMRSLESGLNPLAISKMNGVVIRSQKGYVPPPLVGIWARWPYFHNNSAPSLCAVLTASALRPRTYWAGEALDPAVDFDSECNGYPTGDAVPPLWKRNADFRYDTTRPGMTNTGHDQRIFVVDGREIFSSEDKKDLIQFLQTL